VRVAGLLRCVGGDPPAWVLPKTSELQPAQLISANRWALLSGCQPHTISLEEVPQAGISSLPASPVGGQPDTPPPEPGGSTRPLLPSTLLIDRCSASETCPDPRLRQFSILLDLGCVRRCGLAALSRYSQVPKSLTWPRLPLVMSPPWSSRAELATIRCGPCAFRILRSCCARTQTQRVTWTPGGSLRRRFRGLWSITLGGVCACLDVSREHSVRAAPNQCDAGFPSALQVASPTIPQPFYHDIVDR